MKMMVMMYYEDGHDDDYDDYIGNMMAPFLGGR